MHVSACTVRLGAWIQHIPRVETVPFRYRPELLSYDPRLRGESASGPNREPFTAVMWCLACSGWKRIIPPAARICPGDLPRVALFCFVFGSLCLRCASLLVRCCLAVGSHCLALGSFVRLAFKLSRGSSMLARVASLFPCWFAVGAVLPVSACLILKVISVRSLCDLSVFFVHCDFSIFPVISVSLECLCSCRSLYGYGNICSACVPRGPGC